MARAQIGSEIGVAARDRADETLLASVVADGANLFTVSAAELRNFKVGMVIDIVTKSTGAVGAGAVGRTVTAIDAVNNTITYSGGDLTLTNLFAAYLTGNWEPAAPTAGTGNAPGGNDPYANLNGGFAPNAGFNANGIFNTIDSMRARLTAISATTYSSAELDKMTVNDMVYAIRVTDYPGSL